MTLTSDPRSNRSLAPDEDRYCHQVLSHGRAWASEHETLLKLVFAEFSRSGSWPRHDQLKRELARTRRDFRVLEALEEMPHELGWVDRSSGEIVLKPLALSTVVEARNLLDQFIAALRLAIEGYLSSEPAPRITSAQLKAALDLDELSLRQLGRILVNEHLWLGSTSDQTGALVEAMVSDRVLEFIDVGGLDDFLEVSTCLAYPRPEGRQNLIGRHAARA